MSFLECQGLTRRFGALVAVSDVFLDVARGETRAIIGPNGAGKSTLFNVINGVLKPTAGRTIFAGEDITGLPVHTVAQKGVARTFQITHVLPQLSVAENVRIAAQARDPQRWRFLGGAGIVARTRRAADEALEQLQLTRFADVPAAMMSHGYQRLLEIAMALAQQPKLLLIDEPTQGLSVEETDRAIQILKGMLADGSLTVLLVEHDMDVVFNLADKITVLHQGRVIADGTPEQVRANDDVQSAYLGGLD